MMAILILINKAIEDWLKNFLMGTKRMMTTQLNNRYFVKVTEKAS